MRTSAIYEPRPCNLTPLLAAAALSFPPSLRWGGSSVKVQVRVEGEPELLSASSTLGRLGYQAARVSKRRVSRRQISTNNKF